MAETNFLETLREGDQIVVAEAYGFDTRYRLVTVEKATKAQLTIGGETYWRKNGSRVGSSTDSLSSRRSVTFLPLTEENQQLVRLYQMFQVVSQQNKRVEKLTFRTVLNRVRNTSSTEARMVITAFIQWVEATGKLLNALGIDQPQE